MRIVDRYSGDDLLYFNPKGTIPTAAILKKGEPRTNRFKERKRFDLTDYSAAQLKEVEVDEEGVEDEEGDEEQELDKAKLADMEG
jgi:tRNA pseudouridine38-40 synthase